MFYIFGIIILLISCWLLFVFFRFIFRISSSDFKKSTPNKNLLLWIILATSVFQGCQKYEVEPSDEINKLIQDFNLTKSNEIISKNAITFNTPQEARLFLTDFQDLNTDNPKIKQLLLKGIKHAGYREADLKSIKSVKNSARIDGGPCDGKAGLETVSGSLWPWNNLNVDVTYDNGKITSVNSSVSGFTFGTSFTQNSWQQTGYNSSNKTYTGNVNVYMLINDIGTLYSSHENYIIY